MQKDTILHVIESMPQEVNLDELLNRLYVLDQIEAGERSLQEEGGIPHEEVLKRYSA